MTGPLRIIAGIDLGPETERVVSYAAQFAGRTNSTVRLLYVIDYLLTPPSYLSGYVEEERKKEEAEMVRWKLFLEREGIPAECSVVLGRLHESFVKAIGETSAGLLVIGFKSHMFRPSSSERLIKSLRVPMLVVKGKTAAGQARIKKILCPVDFSENSKKAVVAAAGYASLFSAELTVVHIIPSYHLKERWKAWESMGDGERKQCDEALHGEAETGLASLCAEAGIESKGEVYQGHPAEMAPSLAEKGTYDLIVMGARGLSYVESVLLGSTTEAVLKASPCPVLIVH